MKHFSIVVMIVALWAICAAPFSSGQSLTTLTARGIGPVMLGEDAERLPYSVVGLYDRKIHIDPRDNKEWFSGWEFYDPQGNVAIQAVTDEQGKIVTVIAHGKNITTGEGLRVGMTEKQICAVKGVHPTTGRLAGNSNYPQAAYLARGINLWLDNKGVSEMWVGNQPKVSTRAKMYPDVPQESKEQVNAHASKESIVNSKQNTKTAPPKAQPQNNSLIIKDCSFAGITLGMKMKDVPKSVPGVYDDYIATQADCSESWSFDCFKKNKYDGTNPEIFVEFDDGETNNKVTKITVYAKGARIADTNIAIGAPISKVKNMPGIKPVPYSPSYDYGKNYWVNFDEQTGLIESIVIHYPYE